jgi:legumain
LVFENTFEEKRKMKVIVCLLLAFSAVYAAPAADEGKLWALLVAGSNYYYNYRHQADVCHAYQILHAHGIPDENIVVMMYDDIANNQQNPTKGEIINHPDGKDVYKGVLKDYVGKDVTVENFLNILTGNKAAMKGIGSGKVIESGPNDHVFVNFVDHGATGILAFPVGELTAKQLNDALNKMYNEKRYQKLVLYIEACEAGSMFRNVLSDKINVFATTASDYDESSYACYYDSKRGTYLGDWYSVNWMEDTDKEDIEKETLQTQFTITKNVTTTSHVMEYGDLSISKLVVGQFQGEKPAPPVTYPKVPFEKGAPSWDVPLDILYRHQAAAKTDEEKESFKSLIEDMVEKRGHVDTIVKKIVTRLAVSSEHEQLLTASRPKQLTNLQCHNDLIKAFSRHCFNFGQNPYAMKYAYILGNICEQGALDPDNVIRTMRQVCKAVTITDRID